MSKEEERCMQLNARAINVILGTLSAEVLDEAIFNGQTPPESAHLMCTRDLYGNSKFDDAYECESMESMSIDSSCSGETLRNKQSIEVEQEMQVTDVVLSGPVWQGCRTASRLLR
jgi:hypothetical protein